MRTIVIDQATDLQSLSQRLAGNAAKTQSLSDSLIRLNPHVNFDSLAPGTVLLVADDAAPTTAGTLPPGTQQLEAVATQIKAGLQSTIAGSLGGLATRAAERKAIADAIKTPGMKRAIDGDIDLKARAASVAGEMKQEQVQAKDTEQMLKQLQTSALAELDRLLGLARR